MQIKNKDGGGVYEENGKKVFLPEEMLVSMNLWGFDETIFAHLKEGLTPFLQKELPALPLQCEYLLPSAVQNLLRANKANVRLFRSGDPWFGITYK